jgi:hypothetical protein
MILNFDYGYFEHKDLLQTFFEANDLNGIFMQDDRTIDGVMHSFLIIMTADADTEMKLTFMGIRHAGIRNMFDDYLLKFGPPLVPVTYRNQQLRNASIS